MFSKASLHEDMQVQTQTVQSSVTPLYSRYAIYLQAGPSQQMTESEPPLFALKTFQLHLYEP